MNPAWSVVFLTTLIGAGQGLFLVLYVTELASARGMMPFPGTLFLVAGAVVSVVLTGLGLDAFEMLTVKKGKFAIYKKP